MKTNLIKEIYNQKISYLFLKIIYNITYILILIKFVYKYF